MTDEEKKEAQKARKRAYAAAWEKANRDKRRATDAAWYKANPDKARASAAAWYKANRDKKRATSAAWWEANSDKRRAYAAAWAKANPDKRRASSWRKRGLPDPLRPCPPTCENCGSLPGRMALALDHCHITGAFRGWLCGTCNTGIGKLGDNIEGLERAIAYLRRAEGSG